MRPGAILETGLYCEDLDAAEAFYRTVFSLEPILKQPGRILVYRVGDAVLLVLNPNVTESVQSMVGGARIPLTGARGPGHMAFRATRDDMAAWRSHLEAAGVAVESEVEWPSGGYSIYVRDPGNNSIEIGTSSIWWPDPPVSGLVLPGIGNSGPDHWQTRWEAIDPALRRLHQAEWDAPRCADWVRTLDARLTAADRPVHLVAHSSACLMVAHWAAQAAPANLARVAGALLVGPSDPDGPSYPAGPTGFSPVPLIRLPFPTIVVASTDDEYVALERAREFAAAWGSRIVVLERAGHINSASGLGNWLEGYALLGSL